MSELVIECVDVLVVGGLKHGRVSRVRRDRWMAGWTAVDVRVRGVRTSRPAWAWDHAESVEFAIVYYRGEWLSKGWGATSSHLRVYVRTAPVDPELLADALRLANERNGWVPPLIGDVQRFGGPRFV